MADPDPNKKWQLQATAEIEKRKREGRWSGGVDPLVGYQGRIFDFAEDILGIAKNTLIWSMNGGYDSPTDIKIHDGVHRIHHWDGTPDPIAELGLAVQRGEHTAVESGTGTGKAQPVDTPVLTPDGWFPIGDLEVGDFVVGRDGTPTEVLGVHPQGTLPVYRLTFSDGATTRACAEHLWAVRSSVDANQGRAWRVLSTGQLADPDYLPGHRSWRVPRPEPIELPEKDLPLDPYVLGLLLGDGTYHQSWVRLITKDLELVTAVSEATGLSAHPHARNAFGFSEEDAPRNAPNPVMVSLREMGLSGKRSADKFVPDEYLWASSEQRLALLQGLMDTDGTVRRGLPGFDSMSPHLAEAVAFLCRSLGGVAKVSEMEARLNGKSYGTSFRVYLRLPPETIPFRLERKQKRLRPAKSLARTIRSIEPCGSEECVCITVAARDSLYVTEDFIVTHNSFFCAAAVLYFLGCYKDSRVYTLAPKEDMLTDYIWKEIDQLWPAFTRSFPSAEKTHLRIRMVPGTKGWGAQARTVGVGADEFSATKARGMHAKHMMIILEEATGIHQAVINAVRQTCTAPHNFIVAVGNPDHQFDSLHLLAEKKNVRHIIASSLDHPNVVTGDASIVPGAVSREFLFDRSEDHPPGRRMWEAHVRGRSPSEAEEALINLAWCRGAAKRWGDPSLRNGLPALGVDVANSENGDKGAIAEGIGACLLSVTAKPCPDANELGREVNLKMRISDPPIRARYVGVDSVGVGAGTVNELKRLGKRVRALNSGSKAYRRSDPTPTTRINEEGEEEKVRRVVQEEMFADLRSQMWWQLRKDLQHGRIALPDDPELFRDICTPTWTPRNGKIKVEAKEDIKKRLPSGRSPDRGDAVVLWNWVRSRSPLPDEADPPPDPNEDIHFEEHMERLVEQHQYGGSERRLRRKHGALNRREQG